MTAGTSAVAFLIDEFEEISLQKQIGRREAHDYLATMKRLISLIRDEDLWVVVGMHPDAVRKTEELEPALGERFLNEGSYKFEIKQLTRSDAAKLVEFRLKQVRVKGANVPSLVFPFPEDFTSIVPPSLFSSPRRLVKFGFYALSTGGNQPVPFSHEFIRGVAQSITPSSDITR